MKNLKFFELSVSGVVLRFYLMMAVVIGAGFSGNWLFGLLALPIFLSIMLGVKFNWLAKFEKAAPSKTTILKPSPKEILQNVA